MCYLENNIGLLKIERPLDQIAPLLPYVYPTTPIYFRAARMSLRCNGCGINRRDLVNQGFTLVFLHPFIFVQRECHCVATVDTVEQTDACFSIYVISQNVRNCYELLNFVRM